MTETTREGIERALEEIKAESMEGFPEIKGWSVADVIDIAGYRIMDYDEDEKEAAWEAGADYVRELEMNYINQIAVRMYLNAGLEEAAKMCGDWAYETHLSDYADMAELKREIAELIEFDKENMED